MPIPIHFYTVIVSNAVAEARVAGGAAALQQNLRAQAAEGLLSWACMSPGDVSKLVQTLRQRGLRATRSDPDSDVAVVDMRLGLMGACDWLVVERSPTGLQARLAAADVSPSRSPDEGGAATPAPLAETYPWIGVKLPPIGTKAELRLERGPPDLSLRPRDGVLRHPDIDPDHRVLGPTAQDFLTSEVPRLAQERRQEMVIYWAPGERTVVARDGSIAVTRSRRGSGPEG